MAKRTLVVLMIISLMIFTFCTKKSTSPEEKLNPPSNLTISLVENNKIQINWVDNSTNETKFIIDRKRGEYNWFDNYSEVLANTISFKDNISTNSDTIYSYRVRAFNEEEYSAYTDTVAWISENAKPSNLEIIQLVQDSLKLTWQDNSTGEQYFSIDRKIGNQNWIENYKKVNDNVTEFIDNNTALFDTCYYKIFAVSGISNSDYAENSYIPFLPGPTNLVLQPIGAIEITLTWQDNCHNEEGYRLFFKRGETALWDSLNLTENTEEYSDENVIPGIMNYYKVCAYYENDTSGFIEDEINTLPAPSNLNCTQQNVHTFELNWNDNSQFEQGFKIDRKIDEEDWVTEISITEPNATTWIDSTIGRSYNTIYYRLYAYYDTFRSDIIETNSNITFPAPSNLAYEKLTINSIKLTWNDNSQGEDGLKIDKKVGNADWQNEYSTVSENIQEWTDGNAEINENLMYRVYAYCGNNVSDYATTQEINNTIPAPSNLTYEKIDIATIKFVWTDNSVGEQGFKIDKKVDGNDWQIEYAVLNADIEQWIDYTAEINETIQYRIYAYFGNNFSDYTITQAIDNSFPEPTDLMYDRITINELILTWQDNSIGEQGFKIFRKYDSTDWFEQGQVTENIEQWIDNDVGYGENVHYKVCAFYGSNCSDYANISFYNILEEPSNLTANTVNDTSIVISWNDNCEIEDGFLVERKKEDSNFSFLAYVGQDELIYIDEDVENITKYYYRIQAYSGGYTSDYSNISEAICYNGYILVPDDYNTIQGAINAAIYGDTVLVFPDTYYENINFEGKGILLTSLYHITNEESYINETIVDGNESGSVVTFENGEDLNSILSGFTITNAHSAGIHCYISNPSLEYLIINSCYHYGIDCDNSNPTINNVSISYIENYGISFDESNANITNTIITNCEVGIINDDSHITMTNNTVFNNVRALYAREYSIYYLINSIFWNNGADQFYIDSQSVITAAYSDIQEGWTGTGNIDANPQFINPTSGNYHLNPGSPCIDAGNPDPIYNDPDGSRNDMGAYGGPGGDW